MKIGFKAKVDKILRSYGLRTTSDCIGAVWADGNIILNSLKSLGYRVEKGVNKPDYDFVVLSKKKSTLPNVIQALTLVKTGCIIIFRVDGSLRFVSSWNTLSKIAKFYVHEYSDGKLLGVLFKGG